MKQWLVTAKPVVPLYEKENDRLPREDELLCGMRAELLDERGEWLKIRAEYGFEGYVKKDTLVLLCEEWNRCTKRQVKSLFADVLSEPTVKSSVIMNLPRGARVCVLDEIRGVRTGWCPVQVPDGRLGYMQMSHLMPLFEGRLWGEVRLRERIVEMARTYLGVSYRWGGKTPEGIDCSGLVFMCYWMYGITIYRNAELKEGYAIREIARDQAKPGDLLYFPGHVAMLLDEDCYIHATARAGSDGVVVNSFRPEDPRYREDLKRSLLKIGSIF